MGIFDRLGLSRKRLDALSTPVRLGIVSRWAEGSLTKLVVTDLLGPDLESAIEKLPIERDEAMTVPAVAKARNLLVSSIAKFPMKALRGGQGQSALTETDPGEDVTDDYPWLYRTNGVVSPYERMVCTVDDGFFYGLALWLVDRGAADQITNADYCPWGDWDIVEGKIHVGESPVDAGSVILFNFSTQGLLVEGRKTIRGARDTESAWVGRMRNPIPLIELDVTDDDNLTQQEVDDYVTAWAVARKQVNGAVAATPPGIAIRTHGEVKADLYIENRNAVRTDVGSFANVRASMLDGTAGIDSLTYSTTEGERNSYYEFDLPFWMDPIQARLSQDDIVARGTRIRFDKYQQYAAIPTPTDAPVKD